MCHVLLQYIHMESRREKGSEIISDEDGMSIARTHTHTHTHRKLNYYLICFNEVFLMHPRPAILSEASKLCKKRHALIF